MGKEKKHKKEKTKKHKKERTRKRDRSSSESGSDSEEERRRQIAEKKANLTVVETQAKKVEEYWNKQASKAGSQAKFVWGKKIERDLLRGKDVREFTAAALDKKHQDRMAEIEKVQKRREEKEAEKQRMEEELALLQRQRLAAEAVEQEQKEEEFHLQQAQVRAARRLAQGRSKPVDWLVQDLYGVGEVDNDAVGRQNDDDEDSEEEREQLRRQVEGHDDWTNDLRRGGRGGGYRQDRDPYGGPDPRDRVGFNRAPRGLAVEPYNVMMGLMQEELQELHDEIKGYQELESRVTPLHAEYWGCLLTLAEHELEALHLQDEAAKRGLRLAEAAAGGGSAVPAVRVVGAPLPGQSGAGTGVHAAVQREIEALLAGQTFGQLMQMEKDIQRQLAAGEGDPEYWEAVLPRLKIYAAKARLRQIKAQLLEEQLAAQEEKLDVAAAMGWVDEEEQEVDEDEQQRRLEDGSAFPQGAARIVQEGDIPLDDEEDEETGMQQRQQTRRVLHPDEEIEAEEEAAAAAEQDEAEAGAGSGRMSPPPVDPAELATLEGEVVNEAEDRRMIELLRAKVRIAEAEKFMTAAEMAASHSAAAAGDRAYQNQLLDPRNRARGTHPMMRNIAGGSLETGVERLGPGRQEEQLDDQTRRFREQEILVGLNRLRDSRALGYAPRKPKFFNRIHTGYEWNKYNQTHYDTENPPPKVVQGYKVDPDPSGSKDTCILVFSAGPPYEDIAFRIVNKEWETTQRRGFKCTFDRGILHLYFNFKRARYRR
eukprot:gene11120-11274_t